MLNKGTIVSSALLALGEVKEYNNNNYEIYKVAHDLLEEVLKEFQLSPLRTNFIDYRKLLRASKEYDEEGRRIFLFPIDAVTIVRSVGNVDYEIVGEHIHSYADDLTLIINRVINFNEIKDIYFTILKLLLAKKVAEVYPQYNNKIQYIMAEIQNEEEKIAITEVKGFNYLEKGTAFSRK
ncbi:hypothetical protein [Cetobacterium somerae]|uniref:hypothetical protein n=1 Tax=Cetobacterium somerae TaxID=188913 RepID=UPI0038921D27